MKLFNNPRKAVFFIFTFLFLFLAYLFFGSESDAAEVEVGPTYTSEFNGGYAVVFSERFANKFDVGLSIISEQEWDDVHIGNNGNFWIQYVALKPDRFWMWVPDEVSLGGAYWFKHEDPISSCDTGYWLGMKKRFGDRFSVGYRHGSNAGICKVNSGQDLLLFGWRF